MYTRNQQYCKLINFNKKNFFLIYWVCIIVPDAKLDSKDKNMNSELKELSLLKEKENHIKKCNIM